MERNNGHEFQSRIVLSHNNSLKAGNKISFSNFMFRIFFNVSCQLPGLSYKKLIFCLLEILLELFRIFQGNAKYIIRRPIFVDFFGAAKLEVLD